MNPWQAMVLGLVVAGSGTMRNAAAAEPLTLTREGKPTAAIVVAAKPTKAAQFAAFELQWHVTAISGAVLPIVNDTTAVLPGQTRLFVGDSAPARALGLAQDTLQLQEYAVHTGENELLLVGRDARDFAVVKYHPDKLGDLQANANWPGFWEEQATLYAVYDFLRDGCGVRWFNPTDTGTLLPAQPTLTVKPMEIRRTPTFRYREGTSGNVEGYDQYVSMWGTRDGYKTWDAAAFADFNKRFGGNTMARRQQSTLFLLRMRNGGELCRANHSLYHYYDLYWKPSTDPASAKYFVAKRPELFAQGYEGDAPPQMCYTGRALVEEVAKEARNYFDQGGYPFKTILCNAPIGYKWGENFFCIEPMDNASFCKCTECQKLIATGKDYGVGEHFSTGIHSDYMFNFVSEVAKLVRQTNPDKRIVTLAYGTHAWLPKSVRLDPSVAVQFCFASDGAPWARAEYDHEWKLLRDWADEAKVSGRALYAWCYYGHMYRAFADGGNFHCFPGFFSHAIAAEMKEYKKLGYRGMFHCGLPPEMDTYVMFRLMDNADLSVDRLLDEYFTGLYGAAGAPLKKFYLAAEKVYSRPGYRPTDKNVASTSVEAAWGYLGTEKRMADYAELLAQAKKLAVTEREKRNVELFDLAIWQYMAQGREKYLVRKNAPIPAAAVPAVADAGGDATKVAWDKAVPLTGGWFQRGSDRPASRALTGRIAHDSQYLYLELTDPCVTKNLTASPGVACFDDWEFFLSSQRGMPYRQFLVGPTGLVAAMLNGEVNWRMFVPFTEHGIKVASDTSAPDKWVCRAAIPLKEAVPGGTKPGEKIYLNIVRVSGPAIDGKGLGIDTWVPFTTVLEVDRSAEVTLAKP